MSNQKRNRTAFQSLLVIAWILPTMLSYADTKPENLSQEMSKCAAVIDSVKRLECFDSLTKILPAPTPSSPSAPAPDIGKWRVNESVSPLDDSKTVTISLDANSPVPAKYKRESTPTLVIRCQQKQISAFVNFGFYLTTQNLPVTTRLDKEKATSRTWSISTDYEAVFAPSEREFVKSLLKHQQMLIELTPYSESPVMTTFDLTGLTSAIKPLQEACKL
jgi:type VI secretion system protein VasI